VVSLREDAEGSIWVGANGGLYRLRETLFSSYTERDGLSGDYVRTVFEDRDRQLWVGSASGLDLQTRTAASARCRCTTAAARRRRC
jgi:ligand-binding sensor domain-containing protein